MDLDKIPLWRGNSVSIKQLEEDYARYLYLPRLVSPSVLVDCVRDGVSLITWEGDSFAWADSWDENAQRFQGLRAGQQIALYDEDNPGLLVKPEIALKQMEREAKPVRILLTPERVELPRASRFQFKLAAFDMDGRTLPVSRAVWSATGGVIDGSGVYYAGEATGTYEIDVELEGLHTRSIVSVSDSAPEIQLPPSRSTPPTPRLTRFHGTVTLDPDRVGRDAGRIAEEVITHLSVQKGARLKVILEIQAELPECANETLVRTVTENAKALKFDNHGFERE